MTTIGAMASSTGARDSTQRTAAAISLHSTNPAAGSRDGPEPAAVPTLEEQHAAHLKESTAAMFMFASLGGVLKDVDVAAFRLYRDRLLDDYGNPQDPIEIMFVEQLALAHLNCGQLFYKSSAVNSIECASAYLAATTRLMAEFRRTALALPAYREAVRRLERSDAPVAPSKEKSAPDGKLQEVENPNDRGHVRCQA
jgi:hypothetical protein